MIDISVHQGDYRIRGISHTGILHIYDRNFPRSQVVTGRQADCTPFIGGYDMMPIVAVVCNIGAERLQQ